MNIEGRSTPLKSKVVTREEALSRIHDGQTIMFGDWHGEFAADEIIDGMLEKESKILMRSLYLLEWQIKESES